MQDRQGRDIHYLRISVTDRCNLRCTYCMPEQGVTWLDHREILSYEEILRLARLFAGLGIDRIRLTGGEPLVRKGLPSLVSGLKEIPGIRHIGLTTNGSFLEEQLPALVSAGLDAVNLSLDTLDGAQYAAITRRDELEAALRGLEAAKAVDGLTVKLNCVPTAENRGQWLSLARLAKDAPIDVRFIELMPIGLGDTLPVQTEGEVLALLEGAFGPHLPCRQDGGSGPGRYVTFAGFSGRIGFISAISHQFCDSCNRVRLSATGTLKLCLQYGAGTDLRALLRDGTDDDTLSKIIAQAIYEKPLCHHFGAAHTPADERGNMNQIGG